jgi:retinol dehydrogenase-12
LAPYLLTLLLEPLLIRAATSPGKAPHSVRIVWVTSLLQPLFKRGIPPNGMNFQPDGTPEIIPAQDFMANYMQSKVGDAWLAAHFAEKLGRQGIISVVSRDLQLNGDA